MSHGVRQLNQGSGQTWGREGSSISYLPLGKAELLPSFSPRHRTVALKSSSLSSNSSLQPKVVHHVARVGSGSGGAGKHSRPGRVLTWPFALRLRRLPTRGSRRHGRRAGRRPRTHDLCTVGTKARGGGGRSPQGGKEDGESREREGDARNGGKSLEPRRGEAARESGFPLHRARHADSPEQVPAPSCAAPSAQSISAGPQRPLGAPPSGGVPARPSQLPPQPAPLLPLTASGRGQRP